MLLKLDENHLIIFHEGRARRIKVAELSYDAKKDKYILTYDEKYTQLKNAIALGPIVSIAPLF